MSADYRMIAELCAKCYLAVACLVLTQPLCARGQGTISVLHTGGGGPLVTSSQPLFLPSNFSELEFAFGFATDEQIEPGQFLDSFTVTLQADGDASATVIYFTADLSGVTWAPFSPGTLFISPESIERTVITFPDLSPFTPTPVPIGHRLAYDITVPVPEGLRGQPVTLYFDLFDNQNLHASLGWVEAVPEPSTIWLAVIAGISWLVLHRRTRKQA